jgi:hypothetical protein
MHIERPSETHAGIIPMAPRGKALFWHPKKILRLGSDRLMFDQSVTLRRRDGASERHGGVSDRIAAADVPEAQMAG